MTRHAPLLPRVASSLALGIALLSCGQFSDDSEKFNELDRLRVLAIRSTPADILPGETASLSALVFEPESRRIEYEWSWCPARHGRTGNFECRISEEDLLDAWQELDIDVPLPAYNLGSAPEVQVEHVFSPSLLLPLCAVLVQDEPNPSLAQLACLRDLQVSVQLRVTSAEAEVTAIKNLVLLANEAESQSRNANPTLFGEMEVRLRDDAQELDSDAALIAGKEYELKVNLDSELSERFVPPRGPEDAMGTERQETLVLSWFLTAGSVGENDTIGPDGGGQRNTFVEGQNDFDALLESSWKFPRTASSGPVSVYLVLRDERGGVGWATYDYDVEAVQ